MKTSIRIIWMITLLLFTAGCSGYRVVGSSLDEVVPPPHQGTDGTSLIKNGDRVRLTLVSGEQVEGRVELISSKEIVLDPVDQSVQPRGFEASQIQSVEKKSGSDVSAGPVLAVSAGLLIVGGAILYSETASLRDGMFSK